MPCFWLNRGVSRSNWFLYKSINQLMWFLLQIYQTVMICSITCNSTCNVRVIDSFTTILSTILKCLGTHRTSRINGKYLLHYLDWFLIRNDIQALWCSLQLQPRSPFNKCHNIDCTCVLPPAILLLQSVQKMQTACECWTELFKPHISNQFDHTV